MLLEAPSYKKYGSSTSLPTRPGTKDPVLRIILVHGLRENSKAKKQLVPWIHHLETNIPESKVYTFSFDMADLLKKGRKKLLELSQNLLAFASALLRSPTEVDKATILRGHFVFVGHGIATYVVKQMLSTSLRQQRFLGLLTLAVFTVRLPSLKNATEWQEWHTGAIRLLHKCDKPLKNVLFDFETASKIDEDFAGWMLQISANQFVNTWLMPWNAVARTEKLAGSMEEAAGVFERSEVRGNEQSLEEAARVYQNSLPNSSTDNFLGIPETTDAETRRIVWILKARDASTLARTPSTLSEPKQTRSHRTLSWRSESPIRRRKTSTISHDILSSMVPPVRSETPSSFAQTDSEQLFSSPRAMSQSTQNDSSAQQMDDQKLRPSSPKQVRFEANEAPAEIPTRPTSSSSQSHSRSLQAHGADSYDWAPLSIPRTDTPDILEQPKTAKESSNFSEPHVSDGHSGAHPKVPFSQREGKPMTDRDVRRLEELAETLYEEGDLRLAERLFRKLREEYQLSTTYTLKVLEVEILTGQIVYYQGDFNSSAECFCHLWERERKVYHPNQNDERKQELHEDITRYFGLCRFKQGRYGEAIDLLKDIQKPTEKTISALALVYAHAGKMSLALTTAQPFISRNTTSAVHEGPSTSTKKEVTMAELQLQLSCAMTMSILGVHRATKEMYLTSYPQIQESMGPNHAVLLSEYAVLGSWILASESRAWEAEQEVQRTIQRMCESPELGPNHPSTLQAMQELVNIFKLQGRYSDAEHTARQLITHCTDHTSLGRLHPQTLKARSSLADVLLACGTWDESEKLQRSVVDDAAEADHGARKSLSLSFETTLWRILYTRGKFEQAIEGVQNTMLAQIKLFAEEPERQNGETTITGALQIDAGDLRQAILSGIIQFDDTKTHISSSLPSSQEYILQPQPSLVDSMHCLALCSRDADKEDIEYSDRLLRIVYDIRKRQLGRNNTATMAAFADLAINKRLTGDYVGALKDLDLVAEFREKFTGANNPETLWARYQYACTLQALGKSADALDLHAKTLGTQEYILGDSHIDTVSSRVGLAEALRAVGRLSEASMLLAKAIEQLRQLYLGNEKLESMHPKIIPVMSAHATLLLDLGEAQEARRLQSQILHYYRERCGVHHVRTLAAMNDLAQILEATGDTLKARHLYDDIISKIDLDTPLHASVKSNLAALFFRQSDYEEAETLQQDILSLAERKGGISKQQAIAFRFNLALTKHTIHKQRQEHTVSDEANALLEDAEKLARALYGPGHAQVEGLQRTWEKWNEKRWFREDKFWKG